MTRGAMIQLITKLNPSWTHKAFVLKIKLSSSNWTLQRMGYIMTMSPTAGEISWRGTSGGKRKTPIGTDTETNVAVFKTFSVVGTKQPNKIPSTIARKIHSARKRSRNVSLLIIDSDCWGDMVDDVRPSDTGSSSTEIFVEWFCMVMKEVLAMYYPGCTGGHLLCGTNWY